MSAEVYPHREYRIAIHKESTVAIDMAITGLPFNYNCDTIHLRLLYIYIRGQGWKLSGDGDSDSDDNK